MATTVRPRRSVLFVPGSNDRALEKARQLDADGFIFDLEDAVAPERKQAARVAVCEAMQANDYRARERVIRVNGLGTPWGHQDLVAASNSGADAILIPKTEDADDVLRTVSIMEASGAPSTLAVWCMIETPLGVLHAERVASSSPRVEVLVAGTSDLTKELGASHTRDRVPQLTSLSLCLLAARAYRLGILDGVHLNLADDEGFEMACRQGRELGFDGKTIIHPKTIAVANRIFSPSTEELLWASSIMYAYRQARAEGRGMVVVDGRLIENLHVERAGQMVELAQAIALMEVRVELDKS